MVAPQPSPRVLLTNSLGAPKHLEFHKNRELISPPLVHSLSFYKNFRFDHCPVSSKVNNQKYLFKSLFTQNVFFFSHKKLFQRKALDHFVKATSFLLKFSIDFNSNTNFF